MILNLNPSDDDHDAVADYNLKTMALLTYDEMSLLYMANSRALLYRGTPAWYYNSIVIYLGGQFALSWGGKSLDIFSSSIQPA